MNEYVVLFGEDSRIILTAVNIDAARVMARNMLGDIELSIWRAMPNMNVPAGALLQLVGAR